MYQIKRPLKFDEYSISSTKKFRTILHKKKTTRLEYLSNELFYEIFEYLDSIDVYQAFFNLNSHFNNLLDKSPIPLKMKLNSAMKTELSYHCDTVIKSNKHRILSLSFENNLVIEDFFTRCSIDSIFTRLKSVVFNGIFYNQARSILISLQTLPCLSSLTMNLRTGYISDIVDIYQIIFSFPCLKYNQLSFWQEPDWMFDFIFMNSFATVAFNQRYSTIEYLIINHSCTVPELLSMLRHVPHLRHLSCQNLVGSFSDSNMIEPILLPNLIYLSILNPSMLFFEFEEMLMKLFTMIQIFKIDLFDDITYLNADRWQQLIIKQLPQLRKFYLTHRCSDIDLENTVFLNQFTSSFWTERQWFIEYIMDSTATHYLIRPNSYKHTVIAHYSNRNIQKNDAPPVELRINDISSNESSEEFIDRFKTTTVNTLFTHLTIDCKDIAIGILIRIINSLSNLRSLQILMLPPIEENWLFNENDKEIRFIPAFKNKITDVRLEKIIDIEQIRFILQLCPSTRYLQTNIPENINLNRLISSMCTTNLEFLCLTIPNADNKIIDQLKKIIEIEHCQIERIGDHILINFIRQNC